MPGGVSARRGRQPRKKTKPKLRKSLATKSSGRVKTARAAARKARPRSKRASVPGRGFASMSPTRQRQIASQGGRAAHEQGTAHEFSRAEARAAGQKGGERVSRDRSHMAAIGRKGGES